MAGKSWWPSHEPPRAREESRHPPHRASQWKYGREGGGKCYKLTQQWQIQGRDPPYFETKRKKNLLYDCPPPPYLGVWMTRIHPPSLSEGLDLPLLSHHDCETPWQSNRINKYNAHKLPKHTNARTLKINLSKRNNALEAATKWPKTTKHQNAKSTLEHATMHTTVRTRGILVRAHLITLLASKIRLKLLVVNSVKLHLRWKAQFLKSWRILWGLG